MQKDSIRKKKYYLVLKISSTAVAILVVLAVYGLIDFGRFKNTRNSINPPSREIVHEEKNDQITEFNLVIEKLAIAAPVSPNVDGKDKHIYEQALDDGVAHYKNTALPNSGSNIVIFGHSSTVLGIGKYSRIFARLNELSRGDTIKINFNSREYNYMVEEKKIISALDTSVILASEREQLTLLTCWPVGTAQKRLVVVAKPKP